MMFGNAMYLRPGNLWKSFRVLKMHVDNVDGYAKNSYEDTGTIVDAVMRKRALAGLKKTATAA